MYRNYNIGDYAVWGTFSCSDSNGQCDRISTVCACHCHPGYTSVENKCKKGKMSKNNYKLKETVLSPKFTYHIHFYALP